MLRYTYGISKMKKQKINFTQRFKNIRLFKKPQQQKCFLLAIMHKFFKPVIFWEWTDIALCLRIYQQTKFSNYYIGVDIQVLWLNIWVQCLKKNKT